MANLHTDRNPANSRTQIEFRGVYKNYKNGTHALQDFNLKINRGEFVFVVGPSGAGKSTFMKLIMREEKLSAGEITVSGYKLSKIHRRQIPQLRRTMGIVFQDFRLIQNIVRYIPNEMRVPMDTLSAPMIRMAMR